jgi:hypothetical protein
VLEELAASISAELNEPEFVQLQLDLWPQSERDQFQRNQAALRKRLTEIPTEINEETARIRAPLPIHRRGSFRWPLHF